MAALGLLAVALLALPGGAAADDAGEQVTALMYSAGASRPTSDSVTVGALVANCPETTGEAPPQYESNGTQAPGQQLGENSWTVAAILGCLTTPIDPQAVGSVSVQTDGGTPQEGSGAALAPADLATPSDFADPGELPVVSDDGTGLEYFRPWRGHGDDNAADGVQVVDPAPLVFEVFQGPQLTVTVRASHTKVGVNEPVSFSASVSGTGSGPPRYTWAFPLGIATSRSSAPHDVRFAAAGTYAVSVQVIEGASEGIGMITITVGTHAPAGTGASRTGGGKSKRSRSPLGSLGGSALDPGAITRRTHSGSQGSGSGGAASDSGASNAPTSGGAVADGSSGGPAPPGSGAPRPSPSPADHATPPARDAPSPGTAGSGERTPHRASRAGAGAPKLVSGELIAAITPQAALAAPPRRSPLAAASGTVALRRALSPTSTPAIIAAAVIVLLLTGGARRELRWRRARPHP